MIEVTCAIIIENNLVLATQRSDEMPHPLKWEFPGGKLKHEETPEVCIVREIREELGVEVEVDRRLPHVEHHYGSRSVRLIPFLCTILQGEIHLSEHMEYRWIACGDLEAIDWLEADLGVVEMVKEVLGLRVPGQ
ncbi:MAG: (deoxy)nucleoside triphosphate pyrophosphohydrolase [Bacteroidetes bacterium]|nr:(deoxy)nucleoside triphosphate pyrophosphohydrolase [Bacteroidota bacterium]